MAAGCRYLFVYVFVNVFEIPLVLFFFPRIENLISFLFIESAINFIHVELIKFFLYIKINKHELSH